MGKKLNTRVLKTKRRLKNERLTMKMKNEKTE